MLLTYYMWIKAVKTGSVYWSSMCALAYFYMVRRLRRLHHMCSSFRASSGECELFVCLGVVVGRLRVPDQPHPPPCVGADAHRQVLSPYLRGLLRGVLPGHHPLHADLFCRLSGTQQFF